MGTRAKMSDIRNEPERAMVATLRAAMQEARAILAETEPIMEHYGPVDIECWARPVDLELAALTHYGAALAESLAAFVQS